MTKLNQSKWIFLVSMTLVNIQACSPKKAVVAPTVPEVVDTKIDEKPVGWEKDDRCVDVKQGTIVVKQTFYKEAEVAHGQSCEAGVRFRVCSDDGIMPFQGTGLDWTAESCKVADAPLVKNCGALAEGDIEEKTYYSAESVPFGSDCSEISATLQRVCTDGYMSDSENNSATLMTHTKTSCFVESNQKPSISNLRASIIDGNGQIPSVFNCAVTASDPEDGENLAVEYKWQSLNDGVWTDMAEQTFASLQSEDNSFWNDIVTNSREIRCTATAYDQVGAFSSESISNSIKPGTYDAAFETYAPISLAGSGVLDDANISCNEPKLIDAYGLSWVIETSIDISYDKGSNWELFENGNVASLSSEDFRNTGHPLYSCLTTAYLSTDESVTRETRSETFVATDSPSQGSMVYSRDLTEYEANAYPYDAEDPNGWFREWPTFEVLNWIDADNDGYAIEYQITNDSLHPEINCSEEITMIKDDFGEGVYGIKLYFTPEEVVHPPLVSCSVTQKLKSSSGQVVQTISNVIQLHY